MVSALHLSSVAQGKKALIKAKILVKSKSLNRLTRSLICSQFIFLLFFFWAGPLLHYSYVFLLHYFFHFFFSSHHLPRGPTIWLWGSELYPGVCILYFQNGYQVIIKTIFHLWNCESEIKFDKKIGKFLMLRSKQVGSCGLRKTPQAAY